MWLSLRRSPAGQMIEVNDAPTRPARAALARDETLAVSPPTQGVRPDGQLPQRRVDLPIPLVPGDEEAALVIDVIYGWTTDSDGGSW